MANIRGTDQGETISGTRKADTILGWYGEDIIYGFAGADTLYGSVITPFGLGGGEKDTLFGGDGDDELMGSVNSTEAGDFLHGGMGNDTYITGSPLDTISESDGAKGGMDTIVVRGLTEYSLPTETFFSQIENLQYDGKDFFFVETGEWDDFIGRGNGLANEIWGYHGDDMLYGLSGNDTLHGGRGYDGLFGGQGNDELDGGEDADSLWGDEGHDVLRGGTSGDYLNGGIGDDKLYGGEGGDRMIGASGNDYFEVDSLADIVEEQADQGTDRAFVLVSGYTLGDEVEDMTVSAYSGLFEAHGNASNNIIATEPTRTRLALSFALYGMDGLDTITGGNLSKGQDLLDGGAGADILSGLAGNDTLVGGTGDDTQTGGSNKDTFVFGDGWGDDTITDFKVGEDLIDMRNVSWVFSIDHLIITNIGGGALITFGDDSITLNGLSADKLKPASFLFSGIVRNGTAGDDELFGTTANELMEGLGGNDRLHGGAGNDRLEGGADRNELYGDNGNDLLIGGDTFDLMDGGDGDDTMIGGGGQTTMFGGEGNDAFIGSLNAGNTMYGGLGDDTFTGGSLTDSVYETEGGNDIVHAGGGDDVILDHYGVNSLYGEGGNDWIVSSSDEGSLLDGGDDDDTLQAAYGGNTLLGGNGKDILEVADGGAVANIFTGGADADVFVYRQGVGAESNVIVTDFQDGVDHIGLRAFTNRDLIVVADTAEGALLTYLDDQYSPMLLKGVSASLIDANDFVILA